MIKFIVLALICLTLTQAQEPDPRCPLVNTRPPTHLPHETDCGLFYLCHLGNRVLMPRCPNGKLFDPVASACMPSTQDPDTCVPTTQPTTLPPGTTEVPPTTEAPTTVPGDTEAPTTVPSTDTTTVPTAPTLVPTAPTASTDSTAAP